MMPAYWHKDRYWPSEWDKSDPYKPEILASAIPPGIYCEDEEGFRALQRGARARGRPMETALAGAPARLDGVAVYVAKPAQAAILRATPTKSPGQALADEQSSYEDALATLAKLVARAAPKQPANLAPPPPPPLHSFRGANRALRQAQAAEARRRA